MFIITTTNPAGSVLYLMRESEKRNGQWAYKWTAARKSAHIFWALAIAARVAAQHNGKVEKV